MTELASGVPAQHRDIDETADALSSKPFRTPSTADSQAGTGATFDKVSDYAGDVADKVGGYASGAADRVGGYASGAAGKVGDYASDAADKVGDYASDAADKLGDAAERAVAASGRIAHDVVDRLRNNAELVADRGTTTIADEVVEKIAGIAAREVPGVFDLGGDVARVFASVKERVGLGDTSADQGVSVRLEGKDAAVKLVLVIEYGHVVYTVTEKVRAKVISAVENLVGLNVTAVDILVDDVHVAEDHPLNAGDKPQSSS
jgi:uncharacterized alkaline shock family protein YloU